MTRIEAARAEGTFASRPEGKRYFDLVALSDRSTNVGSHGNRKAHIEAVQRQAADHTHMGGLTAMTEQPQEYHARLSRPGCRRS